MRVLFAVSNWAGHYYPMVPLGWAFQAAGHEVRVACTEPDTGPVGHAGLTPVALLRAPDMLLQARVGAYWNALHGRWPYATGPLHPLTGEAVADLSDFDCAAYLLADMPKSVVPLARASSDAIVEFTRQWRPDLVIHDPLSMEGLLAAKVAGVPAALHLWGLVGTRETEPGLFSAPPDFSGAFRRYGAGTMSFDAIDYVIDPCPRDLRPPVASERLPVRYVPYNGPAVMPGSLPGRSCHPRVCVVWGNSLTLTYGSVTFAVPKILEALADADVEVVLTLGSADAGRLGAVPPNVTALRHAPLHLLLPACDVVIHHGGAGCTMTALAAGVPQLALPVCDGVEQRLNGLRVSAAGAGITIDNHLAHVPAIQSAVTSLLDRDSYREAAGRLRRQLARNPAPAELAATLEALTSSPAIAG
jgi:Erythromycin biosynthesis protein CIII-like, C-terminal domain/Erythromycin biosynthesis protein CIII-like, N-terminal domain